MYALNRQETEMFLADFLLKNIEIVLWTFSPNAPVYILIVFAYILVFTHSLTVFLVSLNISVFLNTSVFPERPVRAICAFLRKRRFEKIGRVAGEIFAKVLIFCKKGSIIK